MPFSRHIPKHKSQMFILSQPGRAGRLLYHRQLESRQEYKNSAGISQAEKCFPFSVTPENSKKFQIFCDSFGAADGPVPDALTLWHVLCFGTGRHLLGFRDFDSGRQFAPNPGYEAENEEF